MTRKNVLLAALLAAGTAISASVAASQEQPKWFVLRNQADDYCWTQLLIQINGSYRFEPALKAAGPFNSEEEALAGQKELQTRGTCRG